LIHVSLEQTLITRVRAIERKVQMSKAAVYRRYAADCLRLARSASDPDDKALLIEMAAGWQRLADRVERMDKEQSSER
jgi:hypothetical protein